MKKMQLAQCERKTKEKKTLRYKQGVIFSNYLRRQPRLDISFTAPVAVTTERPSHTWDLCSLIICFKKLNFRALDRIET